LADPPRVPPGAELDEVLDVELDEEDEDADEQAAASKAMAPTANSVGMRRMGTGRGSSISADGGQGPRPPSQLAMK
jgi:hypothetical protein